MSEWDSIAGPEARTHGAAWAAFRDALTRQQVLTVPATFLRELWLMFLKGWLAKARQADELRGRR